MPISFAYLRYLWAQVTQARAKRSKPPHIVPLEALAIILERTPIEAAIICLGARNRQEPDVWRGYGYLNVQAVDLLPSRGVRFADFHRLPFADATFDLVVAAHSLEHAWDAPLALKEVCRVLRSGGLLWAAWPRGFAPNQHDIQDYGSATAMLSYLHFLGHNVECLWRDDLPTESQVLVRVR